MIRWSVAGCEWTTFAVAVIPSVVVPPTVGTVGAAPQASAGTDSTETETAGAYQSEPIRYFQPPAVTAASTV